jgi:hypothetical protein
VPWKPEYQDEVPTLGYQVGEWIEENCVIPDQEHGGEPYLLTEEMWTFLAHHYRLKPDAREGQLATAFTYRRSMLIRPQKWGKGPLTAAIVCAESVGPTVFAGWDAYGRPLAKERATPRIQITASSEDQTGNVYGHLVPMIQRGPLADVIPDAGITRTNLPYGGHIEPVTSKARSRLGAPITFAIQDETGTWTKENGGQLLADTQRRGLAGMSGRSIETTNAWNPAEQSVVQVGYESKAVDIYRDFPLSPASWSYTDKRDRRRIHKFAYGDSWWVDLDAIEADAAELLERDSAQAERFYGNRIVVGSGSWIVGDLWERAWASA